MKVENYEQIQKLMATLKVYEEFYNRIKEFDKQRETDPMFLQVLFKFYLGGSGEEASSLNIHTAEFEGLEQALIDRARVVLSDEITKIYTQLAKL